MSSEETASVRRRPRKIALRLGGLLTVVMGILVLQSGLQVMTGGEGLMLGLYLTPDALCGASIILFGIVAIVGGISALMARHFSLALVGALLGMIGGGIVNFFLGVLAFAFFFFADEDF